MTNTKKTCSECKEELELHEFHKHVSNGDGVQSRCKKCNNARQRRYNLSHKTQAKAYSLKKYYGLTQEAHDRILVEQNGVCAICGEPEASLFKGKKKNMAVDHDHETDTVRGLLCGKCNKGLGLFNDDLDLLASASSYLINSRLKVKVG